MSISVNEKRGESCLDDRLTPCPSLTLANRLRKTWYCCGQLLSAAFYTMKLLLLTYQNVHELRHFRHCRAVELPQSTKKPRFRAFMLYKETLQQSRQLFSPLRSSRSSALASQISSSHLSASCAEPIPAVQINGEERTQRSMSLARRPKWRRIQAGLLWLRQTPYRLAWKWKSRWHERRFKAKVRALHRQEQTTFVREQHRIAISVQAALFLSLANTIDLKTTKELAVLCQHVSKQRRRKMTTEDLTCFQQTLNQIDNNYETLLTTVQ